jgi:antitoxin YefM
MNRQGGTVPEMTLIDLLYIIMYNNSEEMRMNAITYTAARQNLAKTMEEVCNDHEPVIITSKRDKAVVMISLDDYKSMEETAYLSRSPKNVKRLLSAISEIENGGGRERELIE